MKNAAKQLILIFIYHFFALKAIAQQPKLFGTW